MGWRLKALAFAVALVLVLVGHQGWRFATPFFLYTFSGLIFRRWKKPARDTPTVGSGVSWKRKNPGLIVKLFGVFLLVLALVGIGAGGTFSPLLFGFPGLAILLWGRLSQSSSLGGLRRVRDSILLRGNINPFCWLALAEVKFLTRDVGKALSGVSGRILVATSEESSIYVELRAVAARRTIAEQKILEQLWEVNKTIAPLGAYLLPLDGEKAATTLRISVEPMEISARDFPSFLSSTPYDILSLETECGLMKSIGVYRKSGQRKDGRTSVIPSHDIPSRLPFVSEVLRSVGSRVEWPNPDEYVAFLMSMFATRFATQEMRLTESANATNSQMVLAKSLASPAVELSRAQLRAIQYMCDVPSKKEIDEPIQHDLEERNGHDKFNRWVDSVD